MLTAIPLLFLLLVCLSAYAGAIPQPIMLTYLTASAVAFAFYARDKAAARAGRRRTPERTLHLLAVVGGWPGAMLAQQRLRHKTLKRPFRWVFWFTVSLNLTVSYYLIRYGFVYPFN